MANANFAIKDLDSSSEWLKRAGAENFEYNQSMKQLQDAMREKGGMVGGGGGDGGMPGGEGEGYTWSQTDDEVEVSVDAPAGTKVRGLLSRWGLHAHGVECSRSNQKGFRDESAAARVA